MHREIQIKQFPIVTTHWWPKTRNEWFVWENEQYLYRFLPLVHDHVHVIWVLTRIRCVTCVRARSGSRCIHTGRRCQRLTEGVVKRGYGWQFPWGKGSSAPAWGGGRQGHSWINKKKTDKCEEKNKQGLNAALLYTVRSSVTVWCRKNTRIRRG